MVDTTQPYDSALMRMSDFHRRHGEDRPGGDEVDAGTTRLSQLNPSLMQDLMRFGAGHRPGDALETMEVLAASLRHDRALQVFVQLGYRVMALVVRPRERRLACALSQRQFLDLRLPELRVLRVEPASDTADEAEAALHVWPLGPLLWELALRGSRDTLLPEIAGVAAYRVAPGADLSMLDLTGSLGTAVSRLRQQMSPLREIARWPGFDKSRAVRLLNGLYLQAALMVSRTHPGAIEG